MKTRIDRTLRALDFSLTSLAAALLLVGLSTHWTQL